MELNPVVFVPEFIIVVVYHKIPPVGEEFPDNFPPSAGLRRSDLVQHQFSRLGRVMHIVAVVIQLLDDLPVKEQPVEGDILIGQQRLAGQLQRGKYRVRLARAADFVPVENTVGERKRSNSTSGYVSRPAGHYRQILRGIRQQAVLRHLLCRNVGPLILLQRRHVIPPDGVIPGKPLIQRFPCPQRWHMRA